LAPTSADLPAENRRREARLLGLALAFVVLGALALGLAPAARSASLADGNWRSLHWAIVPVWAAAAWQIRRTLDRVRPQRDPLLLPTALLLTGWGLLLVWRLSPSFGLRQLAWLVAATAALIVLLRQGGDLMWLRRFRYLWLGGGILLTGLTLFFGTNPSGGEPRLWLEAGGVYFQPSEPLRLLLIAYFASYLADRLVLGWETRRPPVVRALAPVLIIWGLSVLLLIVQRDLGTGTLFLVLLALLVYLASERWQVLVAALSLAMLGGALAYVGFDVVRLRVSAWLNPWSDPIGGSYQIVQSLISMASGGVFGRGPGIGYPAFVPVAHSDFIFSSVGEEWGLLGGLAMITLLALFVGRGLRLALRTRDPFRRMLGAGLALAFGLQAIFILGGVMRVLPLTGVTLPFVSYGGSSLLTSFLALGLLLLLSDETSPPLAASLPMRTLHLGFLAAWLVLSAAMGWWTLVRAPTLTARTDNGRRGLAERYSLRGAIFDRNGVVLASSTGEQGGYARIYPAPAAAPALGYDSILYGQAGAEQTYDAYLRGEVGREPLLTWWTHLTLGIPPQGVDLRLTLDAVLQEAVAESFSGRAGAAVVLDPETGEILAMVSSPTFDPMRLEADWEQLVQSPEAPLFNRAVQGRYQPGGALAPFVLAQALESGIAAPASDAGDLQAPLAVDGASLECAAPAGDMDAEDYAAAMRRACPGPFAGLGERLGEDGLRAMTAAFGLSDDPDGIGPGRASAAWPALATPQEMRMAGAGQGALTVSPLHMARALAALVQGGHLPTLRMAQAVRAPAGAWQPLPEDPAVTTSVSDATAAAVLDAMNPGQALTFGLRAQAVSGPGQATLAWYLGASSGEPAARVVVVVLEGERPLAAQAVGEHALTVALQQAVP
jgi:cell division protein FtsW (lipid II flippase)